MRGWYKVLAVVGRVVVLVAGVAHVETPRGGLLVGREIDGRGKVEAIAGRGRRGGRRQLGWSPRFSGALLQIAQPASL